MTSDKHSPEHLSSIAGEVDSSENLVLSNDRIPVALLFPFGSRNEGSQNTETLISHLSAEGKLRLVAANKPVPKYRIFAYWQGLAGVWSQAQKAEVLIVRLSGLSDLLTRWFPALVAARIHNRRVVGLFEFSSTLWQQPILSRIVNYLLRQADGLVSPTEWQAAALHRVGLRATVIPPVQTAAVGVPLSSVQPHIGLWLSKESRTELDRILQSFRLVKQKYPRAELTVIAAGNLTEFIESAVSESGMHPGASVHLQFVGKAAQVKGLVEKPLFRSEPLKCHPGEGRGPVLTYWKTRLDSRLRGNDRLQKATNIPSSTVPKDWDTAICLGTDTAFPTELLSAWRTGAPVLVPGYSLVSSLVRDRYNGLIYSNYSAGSLADAIIELVENPSLVQQLSAQGLKESAAFDWPALRQRWWSILAPPSM